MSKKISISELDHIIEEQIKNVEKMKSLTLKVGLPSDVPLSQEIYGGETVHEIGIQHEYGTDKVPRRSWLRMPLFMKQDKIRRNIEVQFNKVLEDGKPAEEALDIIGAIAKKVITEAFETNGYGNWAQNAPSTIEEKGSSRPLVDSATLKNSVTWRVS